MCIISINNNSPGWTALMFLGPVRGCGLPQKAQFCFRALEKDQRLVEYKNNYQNWPMLLGNYVGRPRPICPRERVKEWKHYRYELPSRIRLLILSMISRFFGGVVRKKFLDILFAVSQARDRRHGRQQVLLGSSSPEGKINIQKQGKSDEILWFFSTGFYQTFLFITLYWNKFSQKFFLCLNIEFILGTIA